MTIRSKLFATVALPVLALSLVVTPAMARSQNGSWLIAQAETEDGQILEDQAADGQSADGQAADGEEAPVKKKKKHRQSQEQAPAEEQAPAAEAPAAEQQQEQAPAAEAPAAAAEEQAPAAQEQAPAEEPVKKKKSKKQKSADTQTEQAPAEEAPAAEAPAEEQPMQQEAAPAEEPAAAAQPEAEQPKKKKKKHKEAEQAAPAAEEAAPAAEEAAPAAEQAAPAAGETEQAPAVDTAPAATATEQTPAEQAAPESTSKKKHKGKNKKNAPADEPAAAAPDATAPDATAPDAMAPDATAPDATAPGTKAGTESGAAAPAAGDAAQSTTDAPVPPADNSLTQEEKTKIAADPSKTTDTVILPVENGAAVLDSDKDATSSNANATQDLSKARAAEEVAPPPKTDADAQAAMPVMETKAVQAAIQEEGTKVSEAPQFAVPGVTNVTNNTVINNTVTNNTVNNTENQVTVVNQVNDTTVLDVGGRIVVRSDDRPRLRMDSSDSYYEQLSRGRTRETIVRENGSRIVTVYNPYGDIIQRSRISRDGDEYVMIYAPEADTEEPRRIYDAGYDLPPMRLTVPVDDYIISTSAEPREDYYTFLEKPPVERVERVYSLDEVKYSARIRDKVRRIDLDTITFATGSAEVPLNQAKSLRKVADAMLKVLKKDPGETFLIEGHTDAVGSDQSNLVLSDERASSVASLLTDVYGIPPENLTTQGYGERYLKVRTAGPEQQNRRVTIRRVTALIRPVAKAQ